MKNLIILLLFSFLVSSCATTGQYMYVESAKIITQDNSTYMVNNSEIFLNDFVLIVKNPNYEQTIDRQNIKYISVNSIYIKKGLHFVFPYIKK